MHAWRKWVGPAHEDQAASAGTAFLGRLHLFLFIVALFYAFYTLALKQWARFVVWFAVFFAMLVPQCFFLNGVQPPTALRISVLLGVGVGMGVVYDVLTLGIMDAWIFVVLVTQVLLAASTPQRVLISAIAGTVLYITVRTVEDITRFGLYELGESGTLADASPEPRPAIGWTDGLPLLVTRLSFLAMSVISAYRSSVQVSIEQEKLAAFLKFADDAVRGFCALDLDATEEVLRHPPSQALAAPFHKLQERMRLYSRFLPETLLDEIDEWVSDDAQNDSVDFSPSGSASETTVDLSPNAGYLDRNALSSGNFRANANPLESVPGPLETGRQLGTSRSDGALPRRRRLESMLNLSVRPRRVTLLAAELNVQAMKNMAMFFTTCTTFATAAMNAVRMYYGVVLNIRADRITASWNSHQRCVRHAYYACRVALEVRNTCSESNIQKLGWRVVLTSSDSFLGNIGDDKHRAAFVHGPAMAELQVLPLLAKALHVRTLATEKVQELAVNWMLFRPVDIAASQASSRPVPMFVYELLSDNEGADADTKHMVELFTGGLRALRSDDFAAASERFQELRELYPKDEQVLRIVKALATERLPTPYMRTFVGWELFPRHTGSGANPRPQDTSCSDNAPPDERTGARTRRTSEVSVDAGSFPPEGSQWAASVGSAMRLREAVERTLGLEGAYQDQDLPEEIIDRAGSRWRRSGKSVGQARDEVWQVLGEDGSLCILKCAPLAPSNVAGGNGKPLLGHQSRVEDLFNEVGMLSSLHHENVVSYLSSAVVGGYMLTIVDYVSGGSLQQALENFGALPLTCVRRYVKDILRGLMFLHAKGIVHRDLKPSNILLEPDGVCRLADFGAAAAVRHRPAEGDGSEQEVGVAGKEDIVGTPPYIAPEACCGVVDKLSDIWSLGISTIQLLTNQLPFFIEPGPVAGYRFVHDLAKNDPPMVPTIPDGITPQSLDFISWCLTRDLTLRPPAEGLLMHPFFTEANVLPQGVAPPGAME